MSFMAALPCMLCDAIGSDLAAMNASAVRGWNCPPKDEHIP